MLRKIISPSSLCALALLGGLTFSKTAVALEVLMRGQPAQMTPLKAPRPVTPADIALTVTDVWVDQTAANAVVARDQAIVQAQHLAFQKLAQRNMSADEFKALKLPDDKTIGILVQDFEIKSEQLSATRYVANFTVRFRDGVRKYINVDMNVQVPSASAPAVAAATAAMPDADAADDATDDAASDDQKAAEIDAAEAAAATPPEKIALNSNILVLPYFEGVNGKTTLWEDPNPWREVWEQAAPKSNSPNGKFIVPLGDISDVSAGSSDAVWSGKYATVEKLRQNYAADEVVLAVANKSGPYLTIDMYFFKNDKLLQRQVIQPYVGDKSDAEAYRQGVVEAEAFMAKQDGVTPAASKKSIVESISREVTAQAAANGDAAEPPAEPSAVKSVTTTTTVIPLHPVTGNTSIEAAFSFDSLAAWMDLQKRLATMTPPVGVDLHSISKGGAEFGMRYGGSVDTLQKALSQKGIVMTRPSVVVDSTVVGGSAQKPVYGLQMTN